MDYSAISKTKTKGNVRLEDESNDGGQEPNEFFMWSSGNGVFISPSGDCGVEVLYLHLEIPSGVSPTHCKASYKGLEMLVPTKNDKLRRL